MHNPKHAMSGNFDNGCFAKLVNVFSVLVSTGASSGPFSLFNSILTSHLFYSAEISSFCHHVILSRPFTFIFVSSLSIPTNNF